MHKTVCIIMHEQCISLEKPNKKALHTMNNAASTCTQTTIQITCGKLVENYQILRKSNNKVKQ